MLTTTSRYALKALVFVAARDGASAAEISRGGGVSLKYLELILRNLTRAGLLTSQRGRNGGYRLARPASEITMAEIVRSLDGPLALSACASRTAFRRCDDCEDVETCRIRAVLLEGRDALAAVLDHRSLADLIGSTPES